MEIREIIWLDQFLDKIEHKHGLTADEVAEVLRSRPRITRIEPGDVEGEDLYRALGRTHAGRYVAVFFILKRGGTALPISARDMTPKEKKRYAHGKS